MPENLKFLAFDTSTDRLSVAVTDGTRVWQHAGPGGAQASTGLIPAVMHLLAQAGLELGDLRAVVFGRGPGSFTGLRTACSVAQGLAFGARRGQGIDVLPVHTLMAVAEEARFQQAQARGSERSLRLCALLDARMDEMYVQAYSVSAGVWQADSGCTLVRPENLQPDARTELLCGNVFSVYGKRLAHAAGMEQLEAYPTATALLRLAPALAAGGQCVDAALALPLYVRDKVALTTEERAVVKAQKAQAEAPAPTTAGQPATPSLRSAVRLG